MLIKGVIIEETRLEYLSGLTHEYQHLFYEKNSGNIIDESFETRDNLVGVN